MAQYRHPFETNHLVRHHESASTILRDVSMCIRHLHLPGPATTYTQFHIPSQRPHLQSRLQYHSRWSLELNVYRRRYSVHSRYIYQLLYLIKCPFTLPQKRCEGQEFENLRTEYRHTEKTQKDPCTYIHARIARHFPR